MLLWVTSFISAFVVVVFDFLPCMEEKPNSSSLCLNIESVAVDPSVPVRVPAHVHVSLASLSFGNLTQSVQGAPGSHLWIRHLFDAFYTLRLKKIGGNSVQAMGASAPLSLPLKDEGFLFRGALEILQLMCCLLTRECLESTICEDTSARSVSHSLRTRKRVMQYAGNAKCQTSITWELYWKEISVLCAEDAWMN